MRLIIGMILLILYPSLVLASDFSLIPSISFKEQYNSNILLLTDSAAKRDYLTTISPGVEMIDHSERFDMDLTARWDQLEYAVNSDIDATNQIYDGKLHYRVNPLFDVSAQAGYTRISNPTLLDITATGIFMSAVPWDHFTSSLSANYQVTEKTVASLSYGYERDYFERPGYEDDTTHSVNLGVIYDLGKYLPNVKARINGGYSNYNFSDNRTDNYTGTVGFSKNFSETWSIVVDGGLRYSTSEFSVIEYEYITIFGFQIPIGTIMVPQKNDGWGWIARASLVYNGEYGNVNFDYTKNVTAAYGLNGAAEQNAFTLSTQYRLTKEFSILFSAGYYTLKSDSSEFSAQAINQQTFGVNPGVRYEFTKDLFAEASYEYLTVDYPLANYENTKRDLFSVRLYFQYPFFSRTN
ncbi:MAG TPA: hypothetical protein VMU29_11620 [Smithella sp.]|nr:hypothetical protein [Smithella sp.]